jgi:hypothetical protein
MNWFVFLYNLYKTDETLLDMMKIWHAKLILNV